MRGAFLAAGIALAALAGWVLPSNAATYRDASCEQVTGAPARSDRISCGYLDLSESEASGRQLSLAVAVVSAENEADKQPDPILFLHGGPGGEIVRHAHTFLSHPMLRNRDLVVFDQRAAGMSLPIECTDASDKFFALLAADLPADVAAETQSGIEQACHEEMAEAGADFDAYSTRQTVADIEALREALGIERWNLFGVSYGTTVAIDYVKMHEGRVRAVVLDSVYPPGRPGGDIISRNYVRALDTLFDACRADAECRRAYPGLEVMYFSTLMALDREPLRVPLSGVDSIPNGEYVMNGQDLGLTIHQMMYQRALISLVPKTIELAAHREGEALENLHAVLAQVAGRIDLAARLAVECRERFHLPGRELEDMTPREAFVRKHLVFFDSEEYVCPDWAPTSTPPETAEPISAEVPALLYSGEHDPITPPRYTIDTLSWFPNGQYVHVPHIGHGADRSLACVRGITAGFFEAPEEEVADACIGDVPPIAYVTDVALTSGAMPFAQDVLQEQRPARLVPLALGAAGLLAGIVWTGIAFLRRRDGEDRARLGATTVAGIALVLSALIVLGFFGGVTAAVAQAAGSAAPAMLVFGLPAASGWLLWLPWLAVSLFAIALTMGVAAYVDGEEKRRLHPVGLLAAALAIMFWQIAGLGFFIAA